jgi:hypothetical protein
MVTVLLFLLFWCHFPLIWVDNGGHPFCGETVKPWWTWKGLALLSICKKLRH